MIDKKVKAESTKQSALVRRTGHSQPEVVEVVEAPVVSVEITEKEGLGDIPKRKKKDENV